MDLIIQTLKPQLQKILDVLRSDLSTIRAGRATPSIVENIVVSVYGNTAKMKIMELATCSAADNQTLLLAPFDGSIISEIQKGIMEANVGLNPVIDGQVIRISIPSLTQERREELIKLMHQKLENGRIMVRQVRHDGMNELKKPFGSAQGGQKLSEEEQKRLEKEVQKLIDDFINNIDLLGKQKEQELLQI